MELKSGYKQTEVGLIPQAWEVKRLGDLFNFSGGYSASRDQLSNEGHCYLHYGDIHGATKTFVDVRADYQDIPKLNIHLKQVSSKSMLEDGDVVFVDASEDDEGTSRHVVVVNRDNIPFISGLHTIVAKSKTAELAHEYRRYCFQTSAIRQQFLFYAVGTKVSGISKTNIAKLTMPVPKIPEQRAIAEALSDVDALLGALEHLIAKKRDLKQAATQQLLTGQTRLPGFYGEWEETTLGQIGECIIGLTYKPENVVEYGLLVLRSSNVQNAQLAYDDNVYVNFEVPEHLVTRPGDILICVRNGSRALIGKCAMIDEAAAGVTFGAFMSVYRTKHSRFIFHAFQAYDIQRQIYENIGATINQITNKDMNAFRVKLPTVPEQNAIAEVLSDMDAELAALEQRRAKTRALKQGMMQELLTGRTRLVESGKLRVDNQ
jgi:type I restriction enzyme S subunit